MPTRGRTRGGQAFRAVQALKLSLVKSAYVNDNTLSLLNYEVTRNQVTQSGVSSRLHLSRTLGGHRHNRYLGFAITARLGQLEDAGKANPVRK